MPSNLTSGLMNLASRAMANRKLTGSAGLLGPVGSAVRSYSRALRNWFKTPKQEAAEAVKGLARGLQQRITQGAEPPVVPGLAEQIKSQQASALPQRKPDPYSPATMELLRLANDILGRSKIGDAEADELARRIISLLRFAKADPTVQLDQRRTLTDILAWLEHRFQPPTVAPPSPAAEEDEEQNIEVMGRADIGSWTDQQVQQALKGEIRTSGSSNVYSFFWSSDAPVGRTALGGTNGTLFVTFKAWHPGQQGPRPDRAGPTYAYSNVPLRKYQQFEEAASGSAGSAVWDYLRVRGSQFGHQHPYRLVAGVIVPAGGEYVPRKATASGFRARTLVNPRSGERMQSQLAEETWEPQANYSYAQWRQIAQERARNVDRGRPVVDRGRP